MSSPDLDTRIVTWGERVFNSGPVQRAKTRRGMTGLKIVATGKVQQPQTAASVRRKIGLLVKRAPQVMVKISGGGKTIQSIKAHLDYISRNGQITLEDQNGEKLNGKEAIADVRDEWRDGGFPIPDGGQVRQAFNVVLSMPAGTDEAAVLAAARDFAASEFSNFQYVMALHTMDTDPDKEPSPNPHVHLCVKAIGFDGTRLNPRKADLQRWRETFAEKLREHGVEADATRRVHRLQRARGEKQGLRYKTARNEPLHSIGMSPAIADRVLRSKQLERGVLKDFAELARVLATSGDAGDRKLAVGLAKRISERGQAPGRVPEPARERGAPEPNKD